MLSLRPSNWKGCLVDTPGGSLPTQRLPGVAAAHVSAECRGKLDAPVHLGQGARSSLDIHPGRGSCHDFILVMEKRTNMGGGSGGVSRILCPTSNLPYILSE